MRRKRLRRAPKVSGAIIKAELGRAGQALVRLYPMGISLLWKAPLVLALVMVPEFIQHVVEIQIGMFDSREAFRARQFDETRMAIGYLKIAGLVLAILAAARFWATRRRRIAWYSWSGIDWRRFALGFLLFMLVPAAPALFESRLGKSNAEVAGILVSILMLPALFLMLAGLFGDRTTSSRDMWRRSWPWAVLLALLIVLAFVPAQWLHGLNHDWAVGAHPVLLWTLMIMDSLVVGLLAGLSGTALFIGYAAFRDEIGRSRHGRKA